MALIQPTRPGVATGGGDMRRILVPVDPDGYSGAALAQAVSLCTAMTGQIRVVHVRIFDPPLRSCGRFYPQSSQQATDLLEQAVATAWAGGARASGVVVEAQRTQVAQAISAAARDWNAGLIVMGHRPRREITKMLCGSVADLVMREVTCPVQVVRPR
jgi:nucleotide-binding universal stress UspA family protein